MHLRHPRQHGQLGVGWGGAIARGTKRVERFDGAKEEEERERTGINRSIVIQSVCSVDGMG